MRDLEGLGLGDEQVSEVEVTSNKDDNNDNNGNNSNDNIKT